jgi:hypothetical protein
MVGVILRLEETIIPTIKDIHATPANSGSNNLIFLNFILSSFLS